MSGGEEASFVWNSSLVGIEPPLPESGGARPVGVSSFPFAYRQNRTEPRGFACFVIGNGAQWVCRRNPVPAPL